MSELDICRRGGKDIDKGPPEGRMARKILASNVIRYISETYLSPSHFILFHVSWSLSGGGPDHRMRGN